MLVVLLVTTVTGCRCIPEFDLRFVASLALDLGTVRMGATKNKIGVGMVEGLFVDGGNIFHSPFMFCVTFLAFLRFLEAPMETPVVIDILADIFVAIEAESCLSGFVEPFMACGARLFPFGMSFNHLARHQRCFNSVCRSRRSREEKGQSDSSNEVYDMHGL